MSKKNNVLRYTVVALLLFAMVFGTFASLVAAII